MHQLAAGEEESNYCNRNVCFTCRQSQDEMRSKERDVAEIDLALRTSQRELLQRSALVRRVLFKLMESGLFGVIAKQKYFASILV